MPEIDQSDIDQSDIDESRVDEVEPAAGRAEPPAPPAGPPPLTEREREMLAFEGRWWRRAGAKDQAIRERFDLSATRYYQLLNALLDKPAALVEDAVTVRRLRRLRSRSRGAPAQRPGE
ncbi:DUF3263 domain-containing protein [Rhizomonospora bruguierae]|uniref:DUF3263 domain-containing protein n=1 Tax=Rhizomonospora bruguierae TaxID=1581705 RepID=UPI001BCBB65B|nr:DUF3263 domain-containing protein [Micromonospora sp. NBRC 107566]